MANRLLIIQRLIVKKSFNQKEKNKIDYLM